MKYDTVTLNVEHRQILFPKQLRIVGPHSKLQLWIRPGKNCLHSENCAGTYIHVWSPIEPHNCQTLLGYCEVMFREEARWEWEVLCIFKAWNRVFKLEVIIWLHSLDFMGKDTEAWEKWNSLSPNHGLLVTGLGQESQPPLILTQCSFHYIYF